MKPTLQPPPPAPASEAAPAWGLVTRVPLPWAAAGLMAAAALLAATFSWGLSAWLGPAPWLAPVAAALAVAAAAIPAAALLHRLTRGSASQRLLAGGIHSPLGTAKPLFLELAGREWARARRYGTGAALLLVDVDRFARLLESRGTPATDAVLAEMLRQTSPTLRGADLLTRFGDAQMAVFLAQADATGALDVAERIRERTEQMAVPLHSDSQHRRLHVTVSVGVAQLRPAHLNLQALIDDAQDAVLAARQSGGNCVRAAPVDLGRLHPAGGWRDDHRARPK
jgi:diguanylate cyclase